MIAELLVYIYIYIYISKSKKKISLEIKKKKKSNTLNLFSLFISVIESYGTSHLFSNSSNLLVQLFSATIFSNIYPFLSIKLHGQRGILNSPIDEKTSF